MSTKYPLEDEFGDIIKKARLGSGLSVTDVARKTGVDEERLQRMEAYEIRPEPAQVAALAKVLNLSQAKLQAVANEQYVPDPVATTFGKLEVHVLVGQPGEANCYVLADHAKGQTALIDPGVETQRIQKVLDEVGYPLAAILLTHDHGDHTKSLDQFADRVQDTPLDYTTIATPGHSKDSQTYYFGDCAFVGDLLFAGSVGRALPETGWYSTHLDSVRKILVLPDSTVLFPGHGPATTVESERQNNPFIQD